MSDDGIQIQNRRWIDEYLSTKNSKTREAYAFDLKRFASWLLDTEKSLVEVDAYDLNHFFTLLEDRGLGRSAVVRNQVAISGLYRYLKVRRIVQFSPLDDSAFTRRTEPDPAPISYLSEGQARAIVSAVDSRDLDQAAAIRLLLLHGLKVGQVVALRARDIGEEGSIALGTRTVPIGSSTLPIIGDLLVRRDHLGEALLVNQQNRPMTARNIRDFLPKVAAEAGVSGHVTPNMLRNTFIALAQLAGSSLWETGQVAGLRNTTNASRYAVRDNSRALHPVALVDSAMLDSSAKRSLAKADRLLASGLVPPAVVVCWVGAMLEEMLREVAGHKFNKEGEGTLTAYAQELRKKRLISGPEVNRLRSWGDTRNVAAHGHFDDIEYTTALRYLEQVGDWLVDFERSKPGTP